MKPIIYKYKNFTIKIFEYQENYYVEATCILEGEKYTRVYDIDFDVESVVKDEEYIYVNDGDKNQFVIKIEDESGLVIDTFDKDGNHIESIGNYDFWDDVEID